VDERKQKIMVYEVNPLVRSSGYNFIIYIIFRIIGYHFRGIFFRLIDLRRLDFLLFGKVIF